MRIDPRGTSTRRASSDADRAAAAGSATTHTTRRIWPWFVAAAFSLANLFLHKPISDICDALYARIGRGAYEWSMLLAIGALSAAGASWLVGRRRARALLQPPIIGCLLALAAATIAAQQFMLVSNVELIHFPQFGLLAALLLATGLGPHAAWIGATLAGVLDETYQDLVIYAQLHTPLDYNDIVLNAIGAAWVVVLAGGASAAWPGGRRRAVWVGAAAALALALWLAPPRIEARDTFPFWHFRLSHAATGREYHVMAPSEGVAALLGIWGLVAITARTKRRALANPPAALALATALLTVTSACAPAPDQRLAPTSLPNSAERALIAHLSNAGCPATAGSEREFIITFWCGPPLPDFTDARAAEIAAAGFNVVGAPCEGAINLPLNRQALDTAARHGLLLWIADDRLSQYNDLDPQWEARLVDAVADYGDHPALDGYFLVDEPGAEKFVDLGKVVARLKVADARRVPYINLYPDFTPPEVLGTATYRQHVEQFMTLVQPPLLSFDYYPFKNDLDRPTFFDNLTLVRDVAQKHRVPFLLIVQAMPHGPYRDPTEAEIAWQVNQSLAFGARGISYFAYWTPVNVQNADRWQFRNGLVENGQPTEHFAEVSRINAATRAIADQLDGLCSIAVADSARHFGVQLPFGPLEGIDGGPVTAGFFSGKGTLLTLLVNQDYTRARAITLRPRANVTPPEVFDPHSGRWQRPDGDKLDLDAGGAKLVRWT
jgi:hypothetical protein